MSQIELSDEEATVRGLDPENHPQQPPAAPLSVRPTQFAQTSHRTCCVAVIVELATFYQFDADAMTSSRISVDL